MILGSLAILKETYMIHVTGEITTVIGRTGKPAGSKNEPSKHIKMIQKCIPMDM
jgi:hypothetical protein